MDNAGTGTGRFDFLREVNADILKIDGSLVKGASDDIVSRALINGLVHMADTLGMRTVASQVDSTGKLRAVTQLGVDYAQGYRVRKPEHIDDFEFLECGIQLPAASGAARLRALRRRRSRPAAHARFVVAHEIGRELGEHAHLGEVLRGAAGRSR